MTEGKTKKHFLTLKRRKLLFYIAIIGLPILQYLIFYVYTNIQSIALAFQKFDYETQSYSFAGFDNFRDVFRDLQTDEYLKPAFLNTVPIWLLTTFFALPFSFLVGFYMYKKAFGHKVLMVIMVLPSVISSLIFTLMFKYLSDRAVPALWELITGQEISGLLSDPDTVFPTLVIWGVWNALSANFLIIIGSMSGSIDDNLIDAAKLDGCGLLGEFWHVALTCIYPMIVVWYTNAVAGFINVQVSQLPIFGTGAPSKVFTLGYYMTVKLMGETYGTYPYLSALGMCFTLICFPVTLLVRWLMEKFGPTQD